MTEDPGLQLNVQTQGRLTDPDEFGRIIIRSNADGSTVRVSDIAKVELGSRNADISSFFNGAPATLVGIYLAPGANSLAAADGSPVVAHVGPEQDLPMLRPGDDVYVGWAPDASLVLPAVDIPNPHDLKPL
jgi:hypothetical protein